MEEEPQAFMDDYTIVFHIKAESHEQAAYVADRMAELFVAAEVLDADGCDGHILSDTDCAGFIIIEDEKLEVASEIYMRLDPVIEEALGLEAQYPDGTFAVYALVPADIVPWGDEIREEAEA